MFGKKHWFFPDAELPLMGANPDLYGHESIILLNPNDQDAHVEIILHWTDKVPSAPLNAEIKAGCTRCIRVTEKDGILGTPVPVGTQYAISVHSDTPVVAQYGRLDMTTGNMAFYTTPGYAE